MKKTLHKLLVFLTTITLLFGSVPFAFADADGIDQDDSGVLSVEDIVDEEAPADADVDADADLEEPVDEPSGTEETVQEEPAVVDDAKKTAPLSTEPAETPEADPGHIHSAGEWVVTPATFDSNGSRTRSCTECGEIVEEETIYQVSDVSFDNASAVYVSYNGEAITPVLTVKDSQGSVLAQDVDYAVAFADNNKAGKATARVTLKGANYSGTKDFPFTILSSKMKRTNLFVGDTKAATLDPSITNLLGNNVTYSIADESVATVNTFGIVTGVAAGKTVLTAEVGGFAFTSDVTVMKEQTGTLLEEIDDDWCCSYDFIYDGSSSYKIVVNGSWYYDDPCGVEVILWNEETEDEDKEIVKEVDFKSGRGTVFFDSSLMKAGVNYAIYVWGDVEVVEDNDEAVVDAAIYSIPDAEAFAFDETSYDLLTGNKKALAYTSDGGSTGAIKWASSDPAVATVSNGTVTAKGQGTCTISATLKNGYTDYCTINVTKYSELAFVKQNVAITGAVVTKLALVNESAIVDPITWKSSNPKVATVSTAGKVTPKDAGTVTITASVPAINKTATCTVTITPKLKAKNVSIFFKKSYTNKLTPAAGKVTWTSSNKKIATVSSTGKITGQKPGTCTITAKYKNKKYTCKVTVKQIKLSKKTARIARGSTLKLKVTGGSGTIKWKTSNKKVATVSSKGVVKGVEPGTCYISMKRNGYTKKCKVTVFRRQPDFGAYIYDYYTRNNYFSVKIRNWGPKTLTITSGDKVIHFDYKTYDRSVKLKSSVKIKPYTTKYVRFYVQGYTTYPDVEKFRLYYKFSYDGKSYTGNVTNWSSAYKRGSSWYDTYLDDEWYEEWDSY